jgi:hypothetical protein
MPEQYPVEGSRSKSQMGARSNAALSPRGFAEQNEQRGRPGCTFSSSAPMKGLGIPSFTNPAVITP